MKTKTEIPAEALEQMKQEGWATIKEQKQYWIDKEKCICNDGFGMNLSCLIHGKKEAKSNNATYETRQAIAREAADKLRHKGQFIGYEGTLGRDEIASIILSSIEKGIQAFLCEHDGHTLHVSKADVTSNLSNPDSPTADPKLEASDDLSRTESLSEWYDEQEEKWSLRDEGRSDGQGESYSERNS